MQSLPEENLDFLGARGGPYLVPTGFIRRDQLMLEKKCCSGLDEAYTFIVGPEKGVFECSNTGNWNTLDQLLDFGGGGRGRLMGSKLQVWLSYRELIRWSSS